MKRQLETINIGYYISSIKNSIDETSEIWHQLLPVDMAYGDGNDTGIEFQDYFTSVKAFLLSEKTNVCKYVSEKYFCGNIIDKINIIIKKHGVFYHPARIDFLSNKKKYSAVVNVAISESGKDCIRRELDALIKLDPFTRAIPHVFSYGTIDIQSNRSVMMFAAEWFDHFHEFHFSRCGTKKTIVVWDFDQGNYYLTPGETQALFYKTSEIMTDCFNPITTEQIMPWHHAAGDFVLAKTEGGIEVKLITVRQYISVIDNLDTQSPMPDLEMTLVFLVNLSIRMRLDRLDGIAEMTWCDDYLVQSIVDGFFYSLEKKGKLGLFDIPYADIFKYYLKDIDLKDIVEPVETVFLSYNREASDTRLIKDHLVSHSKLLHQSILNNINRQ